MSGFIRALGDAGTVIDSATNTMTRQREQRAQDAARALALQRGVMQNEMGGMELETATQNFNAEQAARAVQVPNLPAAPAIPGIPAMSAMDYETGQPIPPVDEQGNPMPPGSMEIPAVPERPDRVGGFEARAAAYEKNGRWDLAQAERDKARLAKDEGLIEFARSIIAGDDPKQAASRFNSKGKSRIDPDSVTIDAKGIVSGSRIVEGKRVPFTMDPRGTLTALGAMPADKYMATKDGGVFNTTQGRMVKDSTALEDKITLIWTKAAADEIFGGSGKDPARIRELERLMEKYKVPLEEAKNLVYNEPGAVESRTKRVDALFKIMQRSDTSGKPVTELVKDAETAIDLIDAGVKKSAPTPVPGATPRAGATPAAGAKPGKKSSKEKPLPLPAIRPGQPEPYEDGEWYTTPAKGVVRWDGAKKKFFPS